MTISLPYIAYIVFLCVLMVLEFHCLSINRNIRLVRQLAIVSFVLFFGLRYMVGYDSIIYESLFQETGSLFHPTSIHLDVKTEIGWSIYTLLCRTFLGNFELFILLNTLIDGILLHNILNRYSKYYVLGLIIFIGYYGFLFEVEQLRNAKAVLLFIYSLRYVESKETGKYYLMNLLGMTFHTSAILYLIIYPLLNIKTKQLTRFIILAVCLIIFLFRIPVLESTYDFITDISSGRIKAKLLAYKTFQLSLGGPLQICFASLSAIFSYILLVIATSKRLVKFDERNNIFINMFILYFVFLICCYDIGIMSTRLSALFIFAYAILYPNLISTLEIKTNKLFLVLLIVLCSARRVYLYTSVSDVYLYETAFSHKPLEEKKRYIKNATIEQEEINMRKNTAELNAE